MYTNQRFFWIAPWVVPTNYSVTILYFPSKFQPRYNQLQLRTKCQWQEIKESQLVNMSKLYVYRQIIRKVENSTAYSITAVNEFIFSF